VAKKAATSGGPVRRRLADIVYVAKSAIHGNGLFARIPIPKGSYIGSYKGPNAKRNGTYVLWVIGERGEATGRSGRNQLRFLNHSARPNAYFDGFDLYALRTIRPDEEITFDYQWE
jgi:SET domain-containing protein